LPPESAEELLCALLGLDGGLEPLKRILIERTEGNPFFLEESVRALVETGALSGERGAYRQVRPVPTVQVPATACSRDSTFASISGTHSGLSAGTNPASSISATPNAWLLSSPISDGSDGSRRTSASTLG